MRSFLLDIKHEGVGKPIRNLDLEGETELARDCNVVGAVTNEEIQVADVGLASVLRVVHCGDLRRSVIVRSYVSFLDECFFVADEF